MDALFRRQPWVFELVANVVVAALAGHAAATLIAAALPRHSPASPRAPFPASAWAAPKSTDAIIVARDVFCSTCDGTLAPAPPRRELTLLAIMFAPPPSDPRWSVAVVRDEAAAVVGPFVLGERLGDATIVAIEPTSVVLDVGRGRSERLELLQRRVIVVAKRGSVGTFADAVTKTGAHSFQIRRVALDEILAGGLASWPRVVPEASDGEASGLRLIGIRRDGPFAAIGLVDGDRLLEVNGRSIATPDAALAAYTSLRAASHVSLDVQRDRHRVRLEYVIE